MRLYCCFFEKPLLFWRKKNKPCHTWMRGLDTTYRLHVLSGENWKRDFSTGPTYVTILKQSFVYKWWNSVILTWMLYTKTIAALLRYFEPKLRIHYPSILTLNITQWVAYWPQTKGFVTICCTFWKKRHSEIDLNQNIIYESIYCWNRSCNCEETFRETSKSN